MKIRHQITLLAICGLVASASSGTFFAQDQKVGKDKKWDFRVAYGKKGVFEKANVILRPNVEQSVRLSLKYLDKDAEPAEGLTVRLVRLNGTGKAEVIGKAIVGKIEPGGEAPLKFVPAETPKAPPEKEPAPGKIDTPKKVDVPEQLGQGPPFNFELWIGEGDEIKDPSKRLPFTIQIAQPRSYTEATAEFKGGRVSITLKATDLGYTDPPCEIKLAPLAETMPGAETPVDSLLIDKLTDKQEKTLFVKTEFKPGESEAGRVYVTVDGYDRAFMFSFDKGEIKRLEPKNRIRIFAPRFFNPKADPKADPKVGAPLEVKLEADSANGKGFEVGFNRSGGDTFDVYKQVFRAVRDERLAIAVGDGGSLVCKTSVKDWRMSVDTAGVLGKRQIRAKIVGETDKKKDSYLPLESEQELPLFGATSWDKKWAPLSYYNNDKGELEAVEAEVIINSTPPEQVTLADIPAKVLPGEDIVLRAKAKKRDTDNESPITEVRFYVGDPAKTKPIIGVPGANSVWQVKYHVPASAKPEDKLLVTVQFFTAAGLSDKDEAEIPIVAPPVKKARIIGVVTRGDLIQEKVWVYLRDSAAKGEVKATVQTDKEGKFAFPTKAFPVIPPGTYVVQSARPGTGWVGSVNVTVPVIPPDEPIPANIALKQK